MVIEVMRTFARRWYVVLIGLLLTGGLAYGAMLARPPVYHTRALVLLLPSESAVGKGGNPYLLLSGLEQPAGIVVAYFSSAPARAEIRARAPQADYVVAIDDSTRGPVIAVDVTAGSKQNAMATLHLLLSRIPGQLAQLQSRVDTPASATISSMPLAVDNRAHSDRSGTVRLMIAASAVGLLGTTAAAMVLDSWVERRRRALRRLRAEGRRSGDGGRRASAPADDTTAEPGSPESVDVLPDKSVVVGRRT